MKHDLTHVEARPRNETDPATVHTATWHRFHCSCERIGRWMSSESLTRGAFVVHVALATNPAPWRDPEGDIGPEQP